MILDFARLYDPQPFHTDAAAATKTIYGGLIASGFQTLALGFRLVWDTGIIAASSMGSPGAACQPFPLIVSAPLPRREPALITSRPSAF